MGLIEENVAGIKGFNVGDPHHRVVFHIPHDFRLDFKTVSFQFESVLFQSLCNGRFPARVVGADDAFPMLDFAEELFVDNLSLRRYGYHFCIRKSLGDHAGSEVVIRMCMGKVNGRKVLARFQDFNNDPVGIRQGPLRIQENTILFPHYDDGCDGKSVLVAEECLG